jgi:hypothetical protein
VQIRVFLTSAFVGGQWSLSRPGRFTPGKISPVTHWMGGWLGHKFFWTTCRKLLTLPRLELRPLVCPARRYTDCAIPEKYWVFRAQADWTFILPSELPTKERRHLTRKMPPRAYQTSQYVVPHGGNFSRQVAQHFRRKFRR